MEGAPAEYGGPRERVVSKSHRSFLEHLDEGGRLVIPIGRRDGQRLQCITRRGNVFETEELGLVSFVPLVKGIDG